MKVKIYYCDTELKEIEVSKDLTAHEISCTIIFKHKEFNMTNMTHYLVKHNGEWLYGNEYDIKKALN